MREIGICHIVLAKLVKRVKGAGRGEGNTSPLDLQNTNYIWRVNLSRTTVGVATANAFNYSP